MRKLILKTIGYFAIPAFMIITGWHYRLLIANYTSLLHLWPIKISACLILAYFYYLLRGLDIKYARFFFLLSFAALWIPYDLDHMFYSFCHVFLAYVALFIFNYLTYIHLKLNAKKIYLTMIGLCVALILQHGSIIGLCEILYISCSSIFLTNIKASDN